MNLLVALITYNRLGCTKRTLGSFLSTVSVPFTLIVSDNGSTDGTPEYFLEATSYDILAHSENLYPGKACNLAWEVGLSGNPAQEFTHLMRLDNDMEFAEGWSEKAAQYFERYPLLGQLGLDHEAVSPNRPKEFFDFGDDDLPLTFWPGNIGGTNIIRRQLWDQGLRYDETPWRAEENRPTPQEDVKFSLAIRQAGWRFGHMLDRLCWTFVTPDQWDEDPAYYLKTMGERGYRSIFKQFFADHEGATR